jgi:hypothetical protein
MIEGSIVNDITQRYQLRSEEILFTYKLTLNFKVIIRLNQRNFSQLHS